MEGVRSMANRFNRVFRTVFIKIFQHKSIQTEGFLDIHRDTKLKTSHGGTMKLGKNLSTFTNVFLTSNGGRLVIGNNVFFNRYCIVVCMEVQRRIVFTLLYSLKILFSGTKLIKKIVTPHKAPFFLLSPYKIM